MEDKQLTVEQAAINFSASDHSANNAVHGSIKKARKLAFEAGAEWQKQQGMTWYEIEKGELPERTPGDDYTMNLVLCNKDLDQFCRGCYIHSIKEWRHGTGNWQPTHWSYINYPS